MLKPMDQDQDPRRWSTFKKALLFVLLLSAVVWISVWTSGR